MNLPSRHKKISGDNSGMQQSAFSWLMSDIHLPSRRTIITAMGIITAALLIFYGIRYWLNCPENVDFNGLIKNGTHPMLEIAVDLRARHVNRIAFNGAPVSQYPYFIIEPGTGDGVFPLFQNMSKEPATCFISNDGKQYYVIGELHVLFWKQGRGWVDTGVVKNQVCIPQEPD